MDVSLEIANLGCLIIYEEMTHRSVLCIRDQLVKKTSLYYIKILASWDIGHFYH